MAEQPRATALQYLDRALGELKALGFGSEGGSPAPIVALLNQIADLDQDRVAAIARTLDQASHFNDVVREQVANIKVGERYKEIAGAFDSIRDDAKSLVDQYADGKISTMERVGNVWMKMTRGDIAARFDKIRGAYLDVAKETQNQVERETRILEAYRDFRGAMKQSEILALDVLKTAEGKLAGAKALLKTAVDKVAAFSGDDAAARSMLELDRDEALRALQREEKRYQVAKDLSDNITIGYNTSEVIMTRLVQTTNAKERVYAQAVSFFGTNETVLTALTATFTGMHGLHESTQTIEAMKKGVNESLETLSEIGGKVQEAAVRAGYGPTVSAAAVKKLVDSVVSYQERSQAIVEEMRKAATENSKEIRDAVEDGKKRLANLIESGASAALDWT
ncbi:MAG: cell surface protein [Alphaproteobacteria bacterium RIFCSPHIGHO2_12_FULL_63_12]|nr:MAG: cell surface protein [Alphaproteobacteria bacterium RIFCSPHIGHO2_12_FULL_63_12]